MMPFIGIDLGTTYTCVAALKSGRPEVIANEHGNRTTPSCVAFTSERKLVGEAAKQQMSRNASNTVYDIKRLMGRSSRDPVVQADKRTWPFEVIDEDGKPKIKVEYKNHSRILAPVEISSMVLQQMKKCAEEFIGEGVMGAVITVPAYFNDAQRTATKDAAAIADLNVLGLLNEPTAAALAYGLRNESDEKRNVLIYDLGGGTFDVTVLTIESGEFKVKATDGDTHLGGQDFNERLFNHFSSVLAQKSGVDIKTNEKARSRLMGACEKAKRTLSAALRADIELDSLIQNEDFLTHITRARFEQMNEDLFRGTMEKVGKALDDAGMDKDEIQEVVLVGGSTRIPMIRKLLEDYFGRAKICKSIHPDEAVALGAAVYAASLSGKSPEIEISLEDVTPLSLGIETKGGVMSVVVPKNTTIPTKKMKRFTTTTDNQKEVDFLVFEGERPNTERNHLLDKFTLRDISPAPAGIPSFETHFEIDKDGVLEVVAVERGGAQKEGVTITREGRKKSEQEIRQMIENAAKFRQEDDDWERQVKMINDIETAAHNTRRLFEQRQAAEEEEEEDEADEIMRRLRQHAVILRVATTNPPMTMEELGAEARRFNSTLGDVE